jgi:predicted phosphodiesterase
VPNIIQRALALHAEGKTWPEIGAELGLEGEIIRNRAVRFQRKERGAASRVISLKTMTAVAGEGYVPARPTATHKHPTGWEPGIDTAKGTIVSRPSTERDVAWDEQLLHFGFDPELFEVVEPYHVRSWDANVGNGVIKTFWYNRANIIRRRSADDRVDIELLTQLAEHAPRAPKVQTGKQAFVFVWSDLQIGKGTNALVERMTASVDAGTQRLAELRSLGRSIDTVHLHLGGDGIESTDGQYAMQTFEVDLNLRDQRKVYRRMVKFAIDRFTQAGYKVLVTVVPGNHPENRKDGKAYTSFGDNGDVEVVEQVSEICAANPDAYGNVRFVIPNEEMELAIDVHGTILGLAHGHQMKGGVEKWWKEQMAGRQPIGDADLLITGHLHELKVERFLGRWWIQAPALEEESAWYRHEHGAQGTPSVLTFVTSDHQWSDLQIL